MTSPYTKWWLALDLEQKTTLRKRAAQRAERRLSKVIHRSGTEYSENPAVVSVLQCAGQQILELSTDLEMIWAYERDKAGALEEHLDDGAGI